MVFSVIFDQRWLRAKLDKSWEICEWISQAFLISKYLGRAEPETSKMQGKVLCVHSIAIVNTSSFAAARRAMPKKHLCVEAASNWAWEKGIMLTLEDSYTWIF